MEDIKYLELLAKEFPTSQSIITETINLKAILNLPKGTEHFISDVHGEYDAFQHVLRNGSGNIKNKIKSTFRNQLSQEEMISLSTLIYYPKEKIKLETQAMNTDLERASWYHQILEQLIELARVTSSKYTRSKVRKSIPPEFSYIIEELLFTSTKHKNQLNYYENIIETIIELDIADQFISEMCYLIQRLTIDHLHVVGDIFDRGPAPDKIMDDLMDYHSVDIQWGNHDILWMGAACGSAVCIANVVRISARYDNLDILEESYGISLRPLVNLADKYYDKINTQYLPKINQEELSYDENELRQMAKMQQAMAIIQFKLEGEIIQRRPEFEMTDRLVLNQINYEQNSIMIDGENYDLVEAYFPTINPNDPYTLNEDEAHVVEHLVKLFKECDKLQQHMDFLIAKGSMYLAYNDNLLYHGCVPLTKDGDFLKVELDGEILSGKVLFDKFEQAIREAYHQKTKSSVENLDLIWYLWTGKTSPLFGKDKMTTFERYYLKEKNLHKEHKNPYYKLREEEKTCRNILKEFGLDDDKGHIINGHTPIKERDGEDPMKGNNKLIVIDGGFSKAYQRTTGIAGYTLLYNSYGMELAVHQSFLGKLQAITNEEDILSTRRIVFKENDRKRVLETDIGANLLEQISDLKKLMSAYRLGLIKENRSTFE
ncbi:fructose-1,6-bisphosphatase [Vagococcus intermedius]|uniref:Fructose-1,6-bisphosphatase class 3 n=1 Tax=Vagococcus intermedius TaxID=2991418 RepID=A0AAF0I8K6_9ENTE|nr:fructose-1,6-bisphosphatase [Vagococcus intermedius]WEG74249.1 fructose-1,6-bisphosphatase [Vagococcus intermedius]WEG76331.1 fructose-1,6-bisphosphatase [Vagococcus intermedius]